MSLYGMMMAARSLSFYTDQSSVMQNNLANQTTDGFKFDQILGAWDPVSGAPVLNRSVNVKQGEVEQTGNQLDLALQGPGFFVLDTPNGERLTRNGHFSQDREGFLVDEAGRRVLGTDGPILVNEGTVEISDNGLVVVDGEEVAQLRIVTVANPGRLQKEGVHLLVSTEPLVAADRSDVTVRQFAVEQSNVNSIAGIGELITVQRNFMLSMSALTTMDDMLRTVTNDVGRL